MVYAPKSLQKLSDHQEYERAKTCILLRSVQKVCKQPSGQSIATSQTRPTPAEKTRATRTSH